MNAKLYTCIYYILIFLYDVTEIAVFFLLIKLRIIYRTRTISFYHK